MNRHWLDPYVVSGLLSFIVNLGIGGFVVAQAPKKKRNQLFGLFSVAVSGWSIGSFLENVIPDPELALRVLRINYCFAIVLPAFYVHFAYVLVGTLEKRRAEIRCLYGISLALLPFAFSSLFIETLHVMEPYDFRISQPGPVYYGFFGFFCYAIWRVLSTLGKAFVSSSGMRRTELGYLVVANTVAVLAGFEYFSKVFGLAKRPPVDDYLLVGYFGILAYAIVRHHLLDIRIVLRRSLVYSLLIACITALYLVMVLVLERGFQGFVGYKSVFATTLVAFVIAVCFNPLRDRLQAFVDRALFKATTVELAAQREQLLSELRRSEQMKAVGTLAAGLAHEIKNPLASIKTFTGYLDSHYTDPAFRAKFQKIVGGEVERINLIVQQLLEFAKPVPPKLTPLQVHELIDGTLDFLSNELLQKQVEVRRNYGSAASILGDPQQLKQVFLNLLLNSLQAMNGHGRLSVTTVIQGSELLVTIQDNGAGIAPQDLPHIFEPFFSTKPTGTGLGLAVVQGIIKEHGGRIAVESQVERGTTMTLNLPVAI